MKIVVIGVGLMGSKMLELLILRRNKLKMETLHIIDNDIVDNNFLNLYGLEHGDEKLYKVDFIKEYYKKTFNLTTDKKPYKQGDILDFDIIIDCRDTIDIIKNSSIKINLDGPICRINTILKNDNLSKNKGSYNFGRSLYYAGITSKIAYNILSFNKKIDIIFDMKNKKRYNLSV